MLADQGPLVEAMEASHRHTESVLVLLAKACSQAKLEGVAAECEQLRTVLQDSNSPLANLRNTSTTDVSSVMEDVKKYASDVVSNEFRELQESLRKQSDAAEASLNERFKKLESRVLSELATGEAGEVDERTGRPRLARKAGDAQLLRKMNSRMADFEAQVAKQLQVMSQDVERKVNFLGAQPRVSGADVGSEGHPHHDLNAMKYDLGELKDLLCSHKTDAAQVRRLVLACERDMEDFTAAMDAVNVDLDEMRARVDSTHSIMTSRQRIEASVTAEMSEMRLGMKDVQEAIKSHDAWIEDVSRSLQELHQGCQQQGDELAELRDQTQVKLDAKVDNVAWSDANDGIDASIKTVREMASALRLEVDSRRRKVDEALSQLRWELKQLDDKAGGQHSEALRQVDEKHEAARHLLQDRELRCARLEEAAARHAALQEEVCAKVEAHTGALHERLNKTEADLHKEVSERLAGFERHHAEMQKESGKRTNALDLRISGLQGASGEHKRELAKLRDEVSSLSSRAATHDADISRSSEDLRKLEKLRAEDSARLKQECDAIYEELDQRALEKSIQVLEDHVAKLVRGTVKLCQVVGVFPGARMADGSEEEIDVDVELLSWEDCAQNLAARVEKTWRQLSSSRFRSVLDLVSKKADNSVLRLLQISQQHIENQLDRVRHERELWKEVVDKRAQQPLHLALTLKDPHTGQPIASPATGLVHPVVLANVANGQGMGTPRTMPDAATAPVPTLPVGPPPDSGDQKVNPLTKRIGRPPQGAPPPAKTS